MESPRIERALISVSDKLGLPRFARGLVDAGVELYASGGTRQSLLGEGLPVREVAEYTGFPEMMDGRIKTLHPKVHGGILCRRDRDDDMQAIEGQGIVPFELVVVNLYPFAATVARAGVRFDEAIEQIDIGGPTLVRGAAKNHAFVTIATNPEQYATILEQVQESGTTTSELRRDLAAAAFAHTADYDRAIAAYFAGQVNDDEFPETLRRSYELKQPLRYGENPHQRAAFYATSNARGANLATAMQLHGKELSYNNLLDLDSALAMVRGFSAPAAVVIKHNNPCGAATADSLKAATEKAFAGDPVSAFGSVLGFSKPVDGETAEYLATPGLFVEAIIAPDFEEAAVEILTTKPKWHKNVRLLKVGPFDAPADRFQPRHVDGGILVQESDSLPDEMSEWKVVTDTQPSDALRADLEFAWAMCRHVKSNAIVLAKDRSLVGVGAGQMSRVDSVEISITKAGDRAQGSVLASDAFFPFDDSIHRAAEAGIAAVIQPGGSKGDEAVVAACNKHGLPMIFTGRRHFKH